MCKKRFWVKSLWMKSQLVKSMCKKSLWLKRISGWKVCARRFSGWRVSGWKVYGWKVCARRVSGWRVSGWKVYGWKVCARRVSGWKVYGWNVCARKVSVLSMCIIGGPKFPFESPSSARKADPRISSYVNFCRLHRMDPVRETCIGFNNHLACFAGTEKFSICFWRFGTLWLAKKKSAARSRQRSPWQDLNLNLIPSWRSNEEQTRWN